MLNKYIHFCLFAIFGVIISGSVLAEDLHLQKNSYVSTADAKLIGDFVLKGGVKVPKETKKFFACVDGCKVAFPNANQVTALAACVTQCGRLIPEQ